MRIYIANQLDLECREKHQPYIKLVKKIVSEYACSLTAVSDEQTPYFLLFINSSLQVGLNDEAEQLFSSFLHTFHKFEGRIAPSLITGDEAFNFTKKRAMADFDNFELCAQPSELLSALFIASDQIGIPDTLNEQLRDFDHHSLNLFIPDKIHHLSSDLVTSGRNFTYEVGHGIWCVDDFFERWDCHVNAKILQDDSLNSATTKIAALCATLVRPDKSPWFLYCKN